MDYPYVINFLLMLWLAYLYWKKPNAKYIKWAFALQFIFIAFRAPVVGADTWNYVRYLDGERNFYNYDSRELEYGFVLYREALVFLHANRLACMVISSFLFSFPVYLLYKRYAQNPPLALAMLTIYNIYYVYFCGLRQILGLAIVLMCVIYVLDERKRKWLVFCAGTALGYTFHTSIIIYSIIFIGAYFLPLINKKTAIACIIASGVVGIVLQSFNVLSAFDFFLQLNFSATERLENYLENEDLNEVSSGYLVLRPTIIAIIVFSLIDKDKLNHWFSKIYFIAIIIANLFVSVPMINRLTGGLFIFAPIVFTWIFSHKYQVSAKWRANVNIIVIIFFLYFTQMIVKNNLDSNTDLMSESRMHPYQFFWEDYSNHPSIRYFN